MMGVFIDTFIVLTLNAFVIISTLYVPGGPLENGYTDGLKATINSGNLSQMAFGTVCGDRYGAMFVAVCLFFFAFSTILSWNLFGRINMIYLFGQKANIIYTLIAILFTFAGTILRIDLVWELQDMFDQLMVLPNAIALFALTAVVIKARRQASDELKAASRKRG